MAGVWWQAYGGRRKVAGVRWQGRMVAGVWWQAYGGRCWLWWQALVMVVGVSYGRCIVVVVGYSRGRLMVVGVDYQVLIMVMV